MKLCQIIPYGGQDLWVKLALREFPETRWLILLANRAKPLRKAKYREVLEERQESPEFWKKANSLMQQLKEDEALMPPEKKRRLNLIEPISLDDFHELLRYFRGLFTYIIEKQFKIAVHLNSGPMLWRICLYLTAAEFKSGIQLLYLFDKKTGNRQDLWIYRDLTEQERIIIQILSKNQRISVSEIQDIYKKTTGKGNLSYVLKLVKKLVRDGMILISKEGRTNFIELSSLGFLCEFTRL